MILTIPRFVLVCGLIFLSFASTSRAADIALLRPGLELYEKERFTDAARAWGATAKGLAARGFDASALRGAGLASILASIAYNDANDASAYSSWTAGLEYLLRGGTTWEQERLGLVEKVDSLQRRLASADSSGGSPTLQGEDVVLLGLQDIVSFSEYRGPKPGLNAKSEEQNRIQVSRDYFGRSGGERASKKALPARGRSSVPVSVPTGPAGQGLGPIVPTGRARPTRGPTAPTPAPSPAQNPTPTNPTVSQPAGAIGFGLAGRGAVVAPVTVASAGNPLASRSFLSGRGTAVRAETPDGSAADAQSDAERSTTERSAALAVRGLNDPARRLQVNDQPREQATLAGGAQEAEPRRRPANVVLAAISSAARDTGSQRSRDRRAPRATGVGRQLTAEELRAARAAWRYFQRNRHGTTGFVSSVADYPYVTAWGLGSLLAGMVSANKLGLVEDRVFLTQAATALESMRQMPLYKGELPNREYNAQTAQMIDHQNRVSNSGSGWSAIDIGRLLIWLKIVANWYPPLTEAAEKVVSEWRFDRLVKDGEMNGVFFNGQVERVYQEGRLGYEQYAADGFALWGLPLAKALNAGPVEAVPMGDQTLYYDTRGQAYLTLEPYLLARFELSAMGHGQRTQLDSLYLAQQTYAKKLDTLVAASEDALDKAPWFSYNAVLHDAKPWQCVTAQGQPIDECQWFSTKAAIALHALYGDLYSGELATEAYVLVDPNRGFFAGTYQSGRINRALSLNTNAVVLEALLYLARGRQAFH